MGFQSLPNVDRYPAIEAPVGTREKIGIPLGAIPDIVLLLFRSIDIRDAYSKIFHVSNLVLPSFREISLLFSVPLPAILSWPNQQRADNDLYQHRLRPRPHDVSVHRKQSAYSSIVLRTLFNIGGERLLPDPVS